MGIIAGITRLVPKGGVEPPWYQVPRDFESRASASSATSALRSVLNALAVANSSLSTSPESIVRHHKQLKNDRFPAPGGCRNPAAFD